MTTSSGNSPVQRIAYFAVQAGPRIGEEIPVTAPRVTIGSGRQSDVLIDDDSISSRHAELEHESGAWRITDLDSTNGTFVEGVKLAPNVPTPLHYGATVAFGGLRLHFRPEANADPEAARAAYTPPAQKPSLQERKSGFRMPLWVLVAIILVVLALAFGIFAWMQPDASEMPVEQQGAGEVAPATAPVDPIP